MARATISRASLLISEKGWLAPDTASDLKILGIDRHGHPLLDAVRIEKTKEEGRVAYVGTASAYGAFSEYTKLLQSDGVTRPLQDIILVGDIGNSVFENYLGVAGHVSSALIVKGIWPELHRVSGASSNSSVALRCRDNAELEGKWKSATICETNEHRYCVIDKTSLSSDLDRDWSGFLIAMLIAWCFVDEDSRIEIERDLMNVTIWCLTAFSNKRLSYALEYDSLQHSAYVMVRRESSPRSPISKGRTAFAVPTDAPLMTMGWEDPSWHPIVSGFLIAPS